MLIYRGQGETENGGSQEIKVREVGELGGSDPLKIQPNAWGNYRILYHKTNKEASTVLCSVVKHLRPVQTPLHSCAEPNLIKFDFRATLEQRLIQMAYLRQT